MVLGEYPPSSPLNYAPVRCGPSPLRVPMRLGSEPIPATTPDLHLCPSNDDRLAVVFRVHRRCSSTDVVAAVAERASRRSAEHRSRISWLTACRLMDGVLARNFSHAI